MYGVFDLMKEAYAEHGITYLTLFPSAPSVIQATFPMPSPDSIKGKKIRATGYDGDIIKLLGGSATTIPVAETYMAMKLKTVDGALVNRMMLEVIKLKEVTTDLLITPLKYYNDNQIVNTKSLNALPADLKEMIIRDSKYVALEAYMHHQSQEDYIEALAISKYGLKLYSWSKEDMAKIRKNAIDTIWPKLAGLSPRSAKLIEAHKAFLRDRFQEQI